LRILIIILKIAAETDPHEGKRKVEGLWPIFKIHHQRSRYIFDLYHKRKAISKGKVSFYFKTLKKFYVYKHLSLQNYLTTASKRTLLTRALLLNGRSLDTKIFVASDAFRPETLTLEQIASAEYQNRKWKR
jgi:hypothetical protein